MQKKRDINEYLQQLRRLQNVDVKFLKEADPNMPASPPPMDAPPDMGTVDPSQEDPNVSQEATADIQKGAITLEMVIDKFNTVRAGRSFKEKSIKQQMMQYFEKLSDDEKVSLYAFLKGIAQIVSGEFTGYAPVKPSDVSDTGEPASAEQPAEPAPAESPAPPPAAPPAPPAAAAATPPPAPAQETPPAPTKKVIKSIKPNIITMKPSPKNADGSTAPIPIVPKVRK